MKKLSSVVLLSLLFSGCSEQKTPIVVERNNTMTIKKGHYACKEIHRKDAPKLQGDPRTHIDITYKCVFLYTERVSFNEIEDARRDLLNKYLQDK